MNFCSECGEKVILEVPDRDNRLRHICKSCNTIHYSNPKIVAGCLPISGDKIMLCRRAIEPRHGYWTLPAGFMENDETTMEAALRETEEEAGASVEIRNLYTMISLAHINQVYLMFLADLKDNKYAPGEESLEVELFSEDQIPWNELAFPVIEETLKLFFADRSNNVFSTHIGEMNLIDKSTRQFESRYIKLPV